MISEGFSFSLTITWMHWYIVGKLIAAFLLLKWERKYVELAWHQCVSRFLFHCCVNPEWGFLKGLAAVPVWLIWGTRFGNAFFYRFMPIKTGKNTAKKRPNCPVCQDTGVVKGCQCSCQVVAHWDQQ